MPFPWEQEEPSTTPQKPRVSAGLFIAIGVPCALLLMAIIGALWILPDLRSGRTSKQTAGCLSNLGELAQASLAYAADFDDHLPNGPWIDKLRPYKKSLIDEDLIFSCPVERRLNPAMSGYALNKAIAGVRRSMIATANSTYLFFDSADAHPNAIADPTDLPSPGRHEHGRANNVVFVDGHVKTIPAK